MRPLELQDPFAPVKAAASAGRHAEAARLLEDVVALAPRPDAAVAGAWATVARAAEDAGDATAAERAYRCALERVDWADLHFALGCLLVRAGDRVAGRAALDRALTINPRYRAAAVERALLDAREGRAAEAAAALQALGAGDGGTLRAALDRLRDTDGEAAMESLRATLAEGDHALAAAVAAAQARLEAGDTAAGLAALRVLVDEHPGYADLLALLGSHELRAGQVDDGIETLAQALGVNPGFHAARLELARGLEAVGERERALAEVRAVLAIEPRDPAAQVLAERLSGRRTVTGHGSKVASGRS